MHLLEFNGQPHKFPVLEIYFFKCVPQLLCISDSFRLMILTIQPSLVMSYYSQILDHIFKLFPLLNFQCCPSFILLIQNSYFSRYEFIFNFINMHTLTSTYYF